MTSITQMTPARAEPVDITEITVQAVGQIGSTAAADLEAAADAHERKAHADAEKLRALAATIREQCKTASAHIEAFCLRASDVMNTTKQLADRVAAKPKPIIAGNDDGAPIPQFLEAGPAVGNGAARN